MASIQFPIHFENDMPFVFFKAFTYVAPKPDLYILNKLQEKTAAPIPELGLYLPGDFSEQVQGEWGPEDTYTGGGGDVLAQLTTNAVGFAEKSSARGTKIVNTSKALSGKLPFPSDIWIFKNASPATLSFNFKLIPYNKAEGDAIMNIARLFKQATLPRVDLSTANALLQFPYIWDISFENINGIGIEKDKLYECMAVTSCNIGYQSGTEGAAVYKDGNPVSINLSLQFQSIKRQWLGGA